MATTTGHVGAGGIWMPTQAEAVLITTNESYAIMESVEMVKHKLNEVAEHYQSGDLVFIEVSPKEGGKALINVAHIIGFVSQGEEAQAG